MLQFNGVCEVPNIINVAQSVYPPRLSGPPSTPPDPDLRVRPLPGQVPEPPPLLHMPPTVWLHPAPSVWPRLPLQPPLVEPIIWPRQPPPSSPVSSSQLTTINSFRCLSPNAFLV
jgi:hypothetical protein